MTVTSTSAENSPFVKVELESKEKQGLRVQSKSPQRSTAYSLRDVESALQETREQREMRMHNLFSSFDSTNSGYLDQVRIEKGLEALSSPLQHRYADELLQVCDSNRDGRVDYGEFQKYIDDKELELYQMFQEIDVTQDGYIQPEELRNALFRAGVHISDKELSSFVDHIDQDNNGIITFQEWRDFLLLYPHAVTVTNIYQYWEKVCQVDIGEQAVIPEGISRHLNASKYLIAGGIAGAISRTATAPLDRLKVLLQVQTSSRGSGSGVISGLMQIYKESGVLGFFRGNGLNVLKVAPESAIKFYTFELMKEFLVKDDGTGNKQEIGGWGRLLAGGTAGAVAQTVVYPMDLVKTRLQTFPCTSGKAPPLPVLLKEILTQEGPKALFKGLLPSLIGIIPYAGIDLAAYETLKDLSRNILPKDSEPGPVIQLGCGTISGALGATSVYPLQLVRTRLQAQTLHSSSMYKGMGDCFKRTFEREGILGFYKGLVPNMLKVAPAASITYIVYEEMKKRLSL